jgi:hypothetical protein
MIWSLPRLLYASRHKPAIPDLVRDGITYKEVKSSHAADGRCGRRCRIPAESVCHEFTYKEVIPSHTTDRSRCSSRNWGRA